MRVIVDTNVPLVANGDAPQASYECVLACIDQIEKIIEQGIVTPQVWSQMKEGALALYAYGHQAAFEKGFILQDTMLEFGFDP